MLSVVCIYMSHICIRANSISEVDSLVWFSCVTPLSVPLRDNDCHTWVHLDSDKYNEYSGNVTYFNNCLLFFNYVSETVMALSSCCWILFSKLRYYLTNDELVASVLRWETFEHISTAFGFSFHVFLFILLVDYCIIMNF